jgi:hypothetical protein
MTTQGTRRVGESYDFVPPMPKDLRCGHHVDDDGQIREPADAERA